VDLTIRRKDLLELGPVRPRGWNGKEEGVYELY